MKSNIAIFSVRTNARHILPDGPPEPDAGGGAALGDRGGSSGGGCAGSAVDGDPECDAAQEALLHASEGRYTLAHRIHLQLGESVLKLM